MLSNVIQLVVIIVIFILVLVATYFTTRWIGKTGAIQTQSPNIHVKETFKIAPNKYIQIIELGDQYYAIGVSKDNITFLTALSKDQLDLTPVDKEHSAVSFKDMMNKFCLYLNTRTDRNIIYCKRLVRMFRRKGVKAFARLCLLIIVLLLPTFFCGTVSYAAPPVKSDADQDHIEGNGTTGEVQDPDSPEDFQFSISSNAGATGLSAPLRILLVLTVLSVAPFILLMMTSFTRIIVVLHFVRTALGTQTSPPNQVLLGLALFLTLFIMSPVMVQINDEAIKPFDAGEITQEEALERGMAPLREFMFKQTNRKDIKLFLEIQEKEDEVSVENIDEIPSTVLIPAFMISELRAAFIMGFLLYLPFIVIDMVVSSTLMSMGMMMLPPTTISMPFKLLLFVLADGWDLLIGQVVKTFY